MEQKKKDNIHKGHRKKVKAKFINANGFDGFADHEILEMILFYAYPMKDTNEIAHRFLDSYGSLHDLLASSPNEIIDRLGVTENVAVLLSMIPHINKRFMLSSFKAKESMATFERASRYLNALMVDESYEKMFVLFLNINKQLIKAVQISNGTTDSTSVYPDKIVKEALICRAKFAIIGHNHPSGNAELSNSDYKATVTIKNCLEPIGIKLLDHIIVCNVDYKKNFSFAKNGYLSCGYGTKVD